MVAVTSTTSTDLAVDRTRLAHERTLMAWVRTSASLISFGFTIYKFFQYMRDQGQPVEERTFGPRQFALFLIAIGLIALVLATIQHRYDLSVMRKHYAHVPYSMATIVGGLVAILGIVTFSAVIFRV
jgi:putative membrane protein